MLKFGRKKTTPKPDNIEHRRPLNLPVIPEKDITPEKIAEYLKKGIPIWTWYNPMAKSSGQTSDFIQLALAMEGGALDGFAMFRIEDNLICRYNAVFVGHEMQLNLKLYEIRELKNSNIVELFNSDISTAYEVYHDDDNLAAETLCFVHDITQEMALDYLKDHRVMYVSDAHFKKKTDTI